MASTVSSGNGTDLNELRSIVENLRRERVLWESRDKVQGEVVDLAGRSAALDLLLRWTGPLGVMGEALAAVVGPLEERIRELAGDPTVTLRMFDEQDRPSFDFGLFGPPGAEGPAQKGDTFRSWATLSAGEFIELAACLVAALLEKADVGFRILIVDNLERLTEPYRSDLVGRLGMLIEWGVLDQVLVASTEKLRPDWYATIQAEPKVYKLGGA